MARQEILAFNALCARVCLSVELVSCEALTDACTKGEKKEALAATFIRLAFLDVLASEMLLENSDENSLPPSSTRRAKNCPVLSVSLGRTWLLSDARGRNKAYRTCGAIPPGPLCFQSPSIPPHTVWSILHSICRRRSPPEETVSNNTCSKYPSTRTGMALSHTL